MLACGFEDPFECRFPNSAILRRFKSPGGWLRPESIHAGVKLIGSRIDFLRDFHERARRNLLTELPCGRTEAGIALAIATGGY